MKQQTTTATQASTLSAEGAAGLDAPADRGALRRDGSEVRPENGKGPKNPRTRSEERVEKRAQNEARRAARLAEESARRAKFEGMMETHGPRAAKKALMREVKEEREARRLARLEAHKAQKQARRARRMVRDPARSNRRGREFSLLRSSSASSNALRDIFLSSAKFHHLVPLPSP